MNVNPMNIFWVFFRLFIPWHHPPLFLSLSIPTVDWSQDYWRWGSLFSYLEHKMCSMLLDAADCEKLLWNVVELSAAYYWNVIYKKEDWVHRGGHDGVGEATYLSTTTCTGDVSQFRRWCHTRVSCGRVTGTMHPPYPPADGDERPSVPRLLRRTDPPTDGDNDCLSTVCFRLSNDSGVV